LRRKLSLEYAHRPNIKIRLNEIGFGGEDYVHLTYTTISSNLHVVQRLRMRLISCAHSLAGVVFQQMAFVHLL
jgi:hypothetical protein